MQVELEHRDCRGQCKADPHGPGHRVEAILRGEIAANQTSNHDTGHAADQLLPVCRDDLLDRCSRSAQRLERAGAKHDPQCHQRIFGTGAEHRQDRWPHRPQHRCHRQRERDQNPC